MKNSHLKVNWKALHLPEFQGFNALFASVDGILEIYFEVACLFPCLGCLLTTSTLTMRKSSPHWAQNGSVWGQSHDSQMINYFWGTIKLMTQSKGPYHQHYVWTAD